MLSEKTYSRNFSFLICILVYFPAIIFGYSFARYFEEQINPLWLLLAADVIATLVVFVFSIGFKNSSLYDPYWSVIPPLIAWYWIAKGEANFATNAMLYVILIWAVRLTYNWIAGWRGLAHEDWRYKMLREKNPKAYWLINLAGIHLFPTLMVFAGMLPVYFASGHADTYFDCGGLCFNELILFAGFTISSTAVIIELIADEHLREFKRTAQPGEFLSKGLWRYSRHPNYFGEICFWFGLWVMQMSIAPEYWWTAIGFMAMLLMFVFASIPMMEKRNLENKSGYAEYMKKVSPLVPFFPKR